MKLSIIPEPYDIEYLPGFSKSSAHVTLCKDARMPKDGFIVHIDGTIRIGASSESGFFYAKLLLEQIKFQCGQNIPNVHIEDIPRYTYRAFMIDSCRHFTKVEDIRKMIDHCAKLRFNVFHWHLTDDQGWRPEIKQFPDLIDKGAYRQGSHFSEEQNEDIYGGFYTRDEMEAVVRYAHERHMIVVPEIDMPGHASALLASVPELACDGKEVQVKTHAGIFKDIICAGSDDSYDTLYEILDEICDIFPDEYIHLGGDEAPKEQWRSCPVCKKRIADEGLKDEEELQCYFINRINSYLACKGKKVITWNESLNGGKLDKDITVQMWMDPKGHSKASQNKLINSDFYHYYTDYPYVMTPLKKVYNYNPDINGNVIGIDTPVWTEYIVTFEKMEYMCFPRFIAVAQTAWCRKKTSYEQFRLALEEIMGYYGFKSAAAQTEWDPAFVSRLPGIVNHFGSISRKKRIREFFLNKNT